MRRAACGLALLVLAVAGCGEREERTTPSHTGQLQLMLDFLPNADHAGIYAAQANGRFKDVGLDVKIRTPSDPAAPLRQVAAGRADIAISYEPEVLRARDQGLKVVSVSALVQHPLTSIIALPAAGIKRPADLRGKRVGTAGIDYQKAFLQTILEHARVPPQSVKTRNVGFNLNQALLTKKVDATLGGFLNYEAVELRQKKKDPVVLPVDQLGVPDYDELVFVTSESEAKENGDAIRSFLGAVARGTRDLRKAPVAALLHANPDLDPKLQRASVKILLDQGFFEPPAGKPFGYQQPAKWRAFAKFMKDGELLTGSGGATGAFTNELLPGQAP
jgi:putative hydroxymethylpyrimidine transport system substrate-binding protein